MKRLTMILLCLLAISLAGCAGLPGEGTTPLPVESSTPVPSAVPTPGSAATITPFILIPEEGNMSRGEAFIESHELMIMESYPLQIRLIVSGNLPTPCHQIQVKAAGPDKLGRIHVELYSLVDPEVICIQVLEPFKTEIPLGPYPDGSYTVWLNGEQVGEFTQ